MSYDLFFHRAKPVTEQEFLRFFQNRLHYKIGERKAFYGNETTGVYFWFQGGEDHALAFEMNFYRPHFFALEAMIEVEAVIAHFGFGIEDPQSQGMGKGPFSREGFLRGWNRGNEIGYSVIVPKGAPVISRPTAELETIWRWNYERGGIQTRLGDGVFVPSIRWYEWEGKICSGVIWPDGIPTLIPKVDYILVIRQEFAVSAQKEICMLPDPLVNEVLLPPLNLGYPLPVRKPRYSQTPDKVKSFVRNLMITSSPKGLSMDSVMNLELVEQARHGE